MHIPDFVIVSFWCAILAICWVHHLNGSNKLLDGLQAVFQKYITKNDKINFVLFVCPSCLAAQLCLWFHVYHYFLTKTNQCAADLNYPILSIFLSMYLGSLLEKWLLRPR